MDAFLVQRAMFQATATELHDVAALIHEYRAVDHLATASGTGMRETWARECRQLESCLRSYIAGQPLAVAKRETGYRPAVAGEG